MNINEPKIKLNDSKENTFNQYYALIKVQLQTIVYKLLMFLKSINKKLFNKLYVTNDPINWDLRSNSNNRKIRIMEKS